MTHADGTVFQEFYDWEGGGTIFEIEMEHPRYLKVSPVVKSVRFIVSEGGQVIEFVGAGIPYILPDRTGVLVVFDESSSEFSRSEAPWFFDFPNNAAIYNADGSLRFQLKNPAGEGSYIEAMHPGAMPNYPGTLGGLVGAVENDTEWLHLVDCNNRKLISAGKWVR